MRFERLLLAVLILAGLGAVAYSSAMSIAQTQQLGGTGLNNVSKADVRVLFVRLGSAGSAVSTVDVVTVTLTSSVSGTYLVQVRVNVGGCSSTGSVITSLGPSATTLTVDVTPDCPFNNQATVEVIVTQP